jgi:tetratricopeptide (TPR) repeat protein
MERATRAGWAHCRRVVVVGTAVVCLAAVSHAAAQAVGPSPTEREVYRAFQAGQYERADQLIADARKAGPLADTLVALLARRALERCRWDEAMAVPDSSMSLGSRIAALFARGLGAARSAWPGGQVGPISAARQAAQRLERLSQAEGPGGRADVARTLVLAGIAAAQEERDELALLLAHAVDLDPDAGENASTIPQLPLPVHEVAGDLWLQVDRYDDAIREYEATLARYPDRARAWLGLGRAAAKAGDLPRARDAFTAFLEAWSAADADLPERDEAVAQLR